MLILPEEVDVPMKRRPRANLVIGLWFGLDLASALRGGGNTACWAHLGGFAAGMGFAAYAVGRGLIRMERNERTLRDLWRERNRGHRVTR